MRPSEQQGREKKMRMSNKIHEEMFRIAFQRIAHASTLPEEVTQLVAAYSIEWLDHEIANLVWNGDKTLWDACINYYI